MDGVDIALRAIGAFYVLAGYLAARAALTSNLIDQAIAAISMEKTERIETHRTVWLLSLSALFFAGGVCLMLLLEPAAWLFAISALIQMLFFLVLGPYYFDRTDPPPPAARRRSINASVVYGAATLFAIWAAYTGRLTKLSDAPPMLWGAALAAIGLFWMRPGAWLLAMTAQGLSLAHALADYTLGQPDYASMVLGIIVVLALQQGEVRQAFRTHHA